MAAAPARWTRRIITTLLLVSLTSVVAAGASAHPGASLHALGAGAAPTLTWASVNTSTGPSNRTQDQMAFDPVDNETVLFGGNYPPANAALNDTWTYRAGAWTQVSGLSSAPAGRWGASFAFDAQLGGVVLFGGRDDNSFFNDSWLYAHGSWSRIVSPTAPSPRVGAAMAYDDADHELVLFGGGLGNLPAGSGSPWTTCNGTWVLTAAGWSSLHRAASTTPGNRSTARMVFWPPSGSLILTGGANATSSGTLGPPMNDTWSFRGGVWTKLTLARNEPSVDAAGELAYDPMDHRIVLFGGQDTTSLEINATWAFDGHTWVNWTSRSSTAPPPRGPSGFVFSTGDGAFILFGGTSNRGSIVLGGTWIYA